MSSTPTQPDGGHSAPAEPTVDRRLQEWRSRLNTFADEFDAEISRILTRLSALSFEEPDQAPRAAAGCDQTMEFTLPTASPPAPLNSGSLPSVSVTVPQTMPAAAVSEPNRLAALKAKLSQQMASTGHSHPAGGRTTEGSRS